MEKNSSVPDEEEDACVLKLVEKVETMVSGKLKEIVGNTAVPLDATKNSLRRGESPLGNWLCDMMRNWYSTDLALLNSGCIRGGKVFKEGSLTLGDCISIMPGEDVCMVVRMPGRNLLAAIENSVSRFHLPKPDGVFAQVSGFSFQFDAKNEVGKRVSCVKVGDEELDLEKIYTCCTTDFFVGGKEGYTMFSGEGVELLVDKEEGLILSTLIHNYFTSFQVVMALSSEQKLADRVLQTVHSMKKILLKKSKRHLMEQEESAPAAEAESKDKGELSTCEQVAVANTPTEVEPKQEDSSAPVPSDVVAVETTKAESSEPDSCAVEEPTIIKIPMPDYAENKHTIAPVIDGRIVCMK